MNLVKNNEEMTFCDKYLTLVYTGVFIFLLLENVYAMNMTHLSSINNISMLMKSYKMRIKKNILRSSQDDVCLNKFICFNMGTCQPKLNASNHFLNDYTCKCYNQYLVRKIVNNMVNKHKCDKIRNHCKRKRCLGESQCENTWGNYYCNCPQHKSGRHCEVKDSANFKRVDKVHFAVDPDAVTSHVQYFLMWVEGSLGDNFSFSFSSGDGFSYTSKKQWKKGFPVDHALKFFSVHLRSWLSSNRRESFPMNIFPYTYSSKEAELTVKFSVSNNNQVQFEGNYPVRVFADSTECIPVITMDDCVPGDGKNSLKIRNHYIIRARVAPDCSEYESKLTFQWSIHNLTDNPIPMRWGPEHTYMKYGGVQNNRKEFSISPYSFEYGKYAVELAVFENVDPNINMEKSSNFNIELCLFEVSYEPLVAIISGGNARSIGTKQPLTMDGSQSYDPDKSPSNKKDENIYFLWHCTSPTNIFCKGPREIISRESRFIVSTSNLISGSELNFVLQITSTYSGVTRQSQTRQSVKIIDGDIPEIEIRCLKNCAFGEHGLKSNPDEIISMKVVCLRNCHGEEEENFYQWKYMSNSSKNIEWMKDTQTPDNSTVLIMNENALLPATKSIFEVSGGKSVKSKATLELHTNSGPENGRCSINPSTGISGITNFQITCENFKHKDDLPLKYEFFQKQDLLPIGHGVLIAYGVRPAVINIKLASNGTTNIIVKVTDSFGKYVLDEMKVQVNSCSFLNS